MGDAATTDRRRVESLGLWQQERPAVILANCGDGNRAFLSLIVHRGATSAADIVLPHVEMGLDAIDITIDDKWLDPLVHFVSVVQGGNSGRRGIGFDHIVRMAGRSIVEFYDPPVLPSIIQVDNFQISMIAFTVWCSLNVRSVRFMPRYIRTAIRVLSMSNQFTLDGVSLILAARKLPPHRGSL